MGNDSSLWQMLLEWATLLSGVVACVEFGKWITSIYRHRSSTANQAQPQSCSGVIKFISWARNGINIVMYATILLLVSAMTTTLLWLFVSVFLSPLYPDQYFAQNPKALLAVLAVTVAAWFSIFSIIEVRGASIHKVQATNIAYLTLFSVGAVLGLVVSLGAKFLGVSPNILGWTLMGAFGATGIMIPTIWDGLGRKDACW
jgi:hypothetical protein